ncbi:DNA polymerase III subunit alpha [Secundilactobacillus kimchicus]|uniref:DNA polymerase III subunit alpha n=1 Tax=Secundilactobacillus kimchicus TaxID=528209 RepID=UPI0024A929B7|nr:DNA polymerase III subunit alpha [Secundilactobacillus kimchicus]
MAFVPLSVISSFSLLQSTTSIDDLVKAAKERGYQAIALTDRNVMYATVAFYQACQRAGIQPVIGLTLTTSGIVAEDQAFDLVLLAKDFVGYQHLMKLSSLKNTQATEGPLDFKVVAPLLDHLMVINPVEGELAHWLLQGNMAAVEELIHRQVAVVDAQSILIGANANQPAAVVRQLKTLAADFRVALVALPTIAYLNANDHFAVQVLTAIKDGTTISHLADAKAKTGQLWLKPAADFEAEFKAAGLGAAAQESAHVAATCSVQLQFQKPQLPVFKTPDGQSAQAYLQTLCEQGLKRRFQQNQIAPVDQPAYSDRLAHELAVIDRMGFNDYFLIVWDVMRFSRSSGIITGPGRGSAAGSLVAYVLGITDVDPIAFNLLFERFLNEERAQMPDIDLDIPDDRRDEVLQYTHDKYGHERVGQIITFGTLAAKQAIRDVGRVFGLRPYEQSTWSNAIPNLLHVSLKEALAQSQPLKNLISDSETNALLFETAVKLEGLPRHYSTHAAGVVLSDHPLTEIVPVQNGSEEMLMTQYTKDYVEQVGLLKMDFLGLRNLSIMANALKMVQEQTGQQLPIEQVPLDDPATLALFQHGDTNGVFQFESAGIKNVLQRLRPDSFELVAAVNALYRPGPMENIDHFIRRRFNQEPITYPDASLKPILAPTYGIIVYQEQVMQAASIMGGFTLGQADLLRRAMSKKKKQTMDAMQKRFVEGAEKNGVSTENAVRTFDYIDRFANYGFNRSHAVAYSKMAFELAYLKAHYPAAFFAALLNSVLNNGAKTKLYLMEAKRHQVAILPPDVNRSGSVFQLTDGAIRFGLGSIKGIRRDFLRDLLCERDANGPFKSLHQFLLRLDEKWRKQDLLEALIYAGAFDQFGANRAELVTSLPEFLSSVELSGNSVDLFEALAPKIKPVKDLSLTAKLAKEDEYLGAYLSGHPVEQYQSLMTEKHATPIADLVADQAVTLVIYLTKVRTIRTKRGDEMAFLTGNDLTGDVSVTVFPNLYRSVTEWLDQNQVVVITGKTETNRGNVQVVANTLVPAATANQGKETEHRSLPAPPRWFLRMDIEHDTAAVHQALNDLLAKENGDVPVILFRVKDDTKRVLARRFWLAPTPTVGQELKLLLGEQNVVYQQ